ncbi:MAG: hypothetical protein MJZ11_06845 [Lachnospiraceae bacterium]|nr:hypothetical protein [Lachnospiraceae bacterium]
MMNIRNRMPDVVKLRCNACQEFLEMVINPGWQEKLYSIAKDAVENNHFADNYIAAYEKMRDLGVQNYIISDMDVSFIAQVIRFCGSVVSVKGATKDAVIKLKDDRNLTNHSNENEDEEELYLRGLLALCDLRNFVRVVDKVEVSIPDENRLAFRNKYIPLIDELQDLLDEERIQLVQGKKERKKDIKRILESDAPDREWSDVIEIYMKKNLSMNKDKDSYFLFIIEAAEAGVVQAYSQAADHYYELGEYDRAEYYLHFLFMSEDIKLHDVNSMMLLADMYFKELCARNEDGHEIIQKLISEGNNIVKSNDEKRYELISKSPVMKGKCLNFVEIPNKK